MVLPPDLLEKYQRRRDFYNQTASKTEQIALCQFIRDGHLESQIRKSRKHYLAKTKILCSEAKRIFVEEAKVTAGETGFVSLLEIFGAGNLREVLYRAEEKGFAFLSADESEQGIRLALSCAAVPVAEAVFLNFAMRFKNAFDGNTVSHADVVMRKHYERKRKWRDKRIKY